MSPPETNQTNTEKYGKDKNKLNEEETMLLDLCLSMIYTNIKPRCVRVQAKFGATTTLFFL